MGPALRLGPAGAHVRTMFRAGILPHLMADLSAKGAHSIRTEVSRKVLHLCSAAIPLTYLFCAPRHTMLWLLGAAAAIAVLIELLRRRNARFGVWFRHRVGFMVRDAEWTRVTGATYVLLAGLITVAIYPKPVACAALMILSISDSAASLIGLRFGRQQFLGKSLAGSSAFFISAVAILWLAWPERRGLGLVAALAATVAEALPVLRLGPVELNDNLTIPLMTGAICCLLQTAFATP